MLLLRQLDRAENLRATDLLDGIILRGFEHHTDLSEAKHCSRSNGSISGYPVSIDKRPIRGVEIDHHPNPFTKLNLGVSRGNALVRHDNVIVLGAPNVNDRNANREPMPFELSLSHDEVRQRPPSCRGRRRPLRPWRTGVRGRDCLRAWR